jgi:hypothetical protein
VSLPLLDNNILTSCVLVFLMAIDVVLLVGLVGCLYPSFYIQGGRL